MLFRYGTYEITFVNDKSQFPFKLICLPWIISNVTNECSKISIAVQVCPFVPLFVFAVLLIPSFFLASVNLVAVFDKFRDIAPLIITGVSVKLLYVS